MELLAWSLTTGLQFMTNKEFRMDFFWKHQCTLTFYNMLSKTNMFNFYMKKSLNTFFWMTIFVFFRFLYQIWLQKSVFGLTWTKMFFFNPIFKYFTIYNKNCWQHMRFSYKKSRYGCNSIFHEGNQKKIIKHFAKQVLVC